MAVPESPYAPDVPPQPACIVWVLSQSQPGIPKIARLPSGTLRPADPYLQAKRLPLVVDGCRLPILCHCMPERKASCGSTVQ